MYSNAFDEIFIVKKNRVDRRLDIIEEGLIDASIIIEEVFVNNCPWEYKTNEFVLYSYQLVLSLSAICLYREIETLIIYL